MCIEVIIDEKSQRNHDESPIHYVARGDVWIIHIIKYPLNVSGKNVKLHNLTENSSARSRVDEKSRMHYTKTAKSYFQLGIYSVVPHWHKLDDEKLQCQGLES